VNTILLSEYRDSQHPLDAEDARHIAERLRGHITISRDIATGMAILNPGPNVGVVILPSGRRIECQPKVSVAHLFRMLAIAYKIDARFFQETDAFDDFEELFEFVIAYFADLVESRMTHGLYRSYVEREENLTTVRGRIAIAEDLRRNHVLRHRVVCRYSDFTWDIPENQIIRQTAHLVRGWVRRNRSLRHQLMQIDHRLAEVTPTRLPATVIDRFSYHRLNDDYQPIHRLCRLFLDGLSVSEQQGSFDFQTFLIDMNQLFERFVTAVLEERLPAGLGLQGQYRSTLDRGGQVAIRPDVAISSRGKMALLADCKYKRLFGDDVHHHDLYQMVAYCTAEGIGRGALIYPRHEQLPGKSHAIRNSPIRIAQLAIDLDAPGPAFHEACDQFADQLFELATRNPAPGLGSGVGVGPG
jgi:5-methylcytosine-specific restriction enzyme subunit McrC